MKIIIDENIELAKEAFSELGDIQLVHGRKIDSKILQDADALVVRSITNVNKSLLDGTNVKFVGTATIGTDHIDQDYLKQNGICFTSAAGCNSYAVTEYVFTAIFRLAVEKGINLRDVSIGIIGYGNIGTKVARMANAFGWKVKINDPPLLDEGKLTESVSLEEALDSDIVTLHVPLNKDGKYKTHHLLSEKNISLLKENRILINSCRGPVVDNIILAKKLSKLNDIFNVFDVWENEPNVNNDLLQLTNLSSPHIAGYTLEGKINGTLIVRNKLVDFFNLSSEWKPNYPTIAKDIIEIDENSNFEQFFNQIFSTIYDNNIDTENMNEILKMKTEDVPAYFDGLRKNYNLRREFNNFTIVLSPEQLKYKSLLETLRFNVKKTISREER